MFGYGIVHRCRLAAAAASVVVQPLHWRDTDDVRSLISMCISYDNKVIELVLDVSIDCFSHQQESVQKLLVRRLYFTDTGVL